MSTGPEKQLDKIEQRLKTVEHWTERSWLANDAKREVLRTVRFFGGAFLLVFIFALGIGLLIGLFLLN